MTAGQRVSVSLLVSVLLFAGFSVLAYTGLFDLVEARFYNPAVVKGLEQDMAGAADSADAFVNEMRARFLAMLAEPSIQRSFLPNQSAEDIFERSRLFGLLQTELPAFQSARFIDANGRRLHYSTDTADILRQDRFSLAWRDYGEGADVWPIDRIARPQGSTPLVFVDGERELFVFCYPFNDSFDVYKGTAVFSVSARGLQEALVREFRIKAGEDLFLLDDPDGAVIAFPGSQLPVAARDAVRRLWKEGARGAQPLVIGEDGSSWMLLSRETSSGFMVARVYSGTLFGFPSSMKLLLLAAFFLTAFLLIFLLFNLRQDRLTIARERIKRLQIALLEECYSAKGDFDWDKWTRELSLRRDEVRAEIKRGLPEIAGIDELVDKSWDELLHAMGAVRAPFVANVPFDESRLQVLVDRLADIQRMGPASHAPSPVQPFTTVSADTTGAVEELEEVEELEGLEEVEESEELEELEELEKVEELGEPGDIDTLPVMDVPAGLEGVLPRENTEIPDDLPEVEALPELEGSDRFASLDEPGELEELDELEDADTLEEEPFPAKSITALPDDSESAPPAETLDNILSRIEFSAPAPAVKAGELPRGEDPLAALDIISPFDDMLGSFFAFEPDAAGEEGIEELLAWDDMENESPADLEAVDHESAYIPSFMSNTALDILPLADGELEEDYGELEEVGDSIITEGEDGLVLIDLDRAAALTGPSRSQNIDSELGELVSSVMGPGSGRNQRRR